MKLFGLFSLFFLCTAGCLAQDFNLLAQSLITLTESFGTLQGYLEGFKPKKILTSDEILKLETLKSQLERQENILKMENDPNKQKTIQEKIEKLKKEIATLQDA